MAQPEARLSRKIMEAIRAEGYFCFKVWGNDHTMAGLPDIIVCAYGFFIGLEVKLPEKRDNVSKIQQHRHLQIKAAHGQVFVVCSAKEALQKIHEFLDTELVGEDD